MFNVLTISQPWRYIAADTNYRTGEMNYFIKNDLKHSFLETFGYVPELTLEYPVLFSFVFRSDEDVTLARLML